MSSLNAAVAPSARTRRRQLAPVALGSVVLLVALTSCSASDDSVSAPMSNSAGIAGSGSGVAEVEGASDAGTGALADSGADSGSVTEAQLATGRQQILHADLVVRTATVLTDARRAESAATAAGGVVTDEQTATDPDASGDADRTVSTLTIQVPPDALDDLLTTLTSLSSLVSQSRGTVDVTDEYVDVQARIASQRASLDRLLALVTDASDLSDVIELENEVSRRQSDLDALVARQKALDQQVSMATVTLTLTSETDDVAVSDAGFVSGLRSGWDAFTSSVVGALTVIGAALPFLVLIALIGVPVYLIRSRRRTVPVVVAAAEPPAA